MQSANGRRAVEQLRKCSFDVQQRIKQLVAICGVLAGAAVEQIGVVVLSEQHVVSFAAEQFVEAFASDDAVIARVA